MSVEDAKRPADQNQHSARCPVPLLWSADGSCLSKCPIGNCTRALPSDPVPPGDPVLGRGVILTSQTARLVLQVGLLITSAALTSI